MAVTRISLLAALCLASVFGALAAPSSRIWGGEDVGIGAYPFVVSVRLDGVHIAVGSIISNKHILTSAHGLSELNTSPVASNRVTVRVGSINQYAGGQIVSVSDIHINPAYGNFLHDIAVVTLQNELTFTERISSIEISEEEIADDVEVSVFGWGLLQSGATSYKLQEITLQTLGAPECELESGFGYEATLCLQHPVGNGICRGDEGAPVVADGKLVGVASFAFGNCATQFPDVACRVEHYYEWIDSLITP